MNPPSISKLLFATALLLLLAGCHDRVSERLAGDYRATFLKWQMELYNNREGIEKAAGALLDLETSLKEGLGLTWYSAHRNDAWFERELKSYAQVHADWSQRFRQNNSDTEMFLASTDEWVRNLPSSNLSRETSSEMWARLQEEEKALVTGQKALQTELNTVVKVRYNTMLNEARKGGSDEVIVP